MVENLDANVGKMMAFLKAEGLLDDTVVVFLSDHGELAGAHGLRAKQWPYEESVGIPLMVWDTRIGERAGNGDRSSDVYRGFVSNAAGAGWISSQK